MVFFPLFETGRQVALASEAIPTQLAAQERKTLLLAIVLCRTPSHPSAYCLSQFVPCFVYPAASSPPSNSVSRPASNSTPGRQTKEAGDLAAKNGTARSNNLEKSEREVKSSEANRGAASRPQAALPHTPPPLKSGVDRLPPHSEEDLLRGLTLQAIWSENVEVTSLMNAAFKIARYIFSSQTCTWCSLGWGAKLGDSATLGHSGFSSVADSPRGNCQASGFMDSNHASSGVSGAAHRDTLPQRQANEASFVPCPAGVSRQLM